MDLLLRPITNICSGHRWRLATRLRVRLAATEFRARRGPRPHLAATRPPPLVGYLGDEDPRHRHRDSEGWLAYLRLEDRPGLSPITTVGRSTPSKMHRWRPTRCGRRGDPLRSASLKERGRVKEVVGWTCRLWLLGPVGERALSAWPRSWLAVGHPGGGLALTPASDDADSSSGPDGQRGARFGRGLGCRTVVLTI